ncbi:hypothetical protein GF402_08910 [Candidatus Fermentibacteria bacterium]|nr:hypothetical protein [Candidatus Fermentibacteria bacterium]
MLRPALIVLLLVLTTAGATPLDTVYDFLYAVRYGNLESSLDLLSEDLVSQLEASCEQLITLAETEPRLVERMLTALGTPLRPAQVAAMDPRELLAAFLQRVPDLPENLVEEENLEMSGRRAEVRLTTVYGARIDFELVWEEGAWRITWSSLLRDLFDSI